MVAPAGAGEASEGEGLITEYTDIPVETTDGVIIGKAIFRIEQDSQEHRASIVIDSELAREVMKGLSTGKFGEVWVETDN